MLFRRGRGHSPQSQRVVGEGTQEGWGGERGSVEKGRGGADLDKVRGEGETRRGEAGGRRGEEGKRGDGPMCVPLPLSPTSGFSTLL